MTYVERLWPQRGNDIEHWGWLAGKLTKKEKLDRPLLIGIRGVGPEESETHPLIARPQYDDTFIILEKDGASEPFCFAAATHAYQRDSKLSPDVNGDGREDVGTIRTGNYLLTLGVEKPYPIFILTTPDGNGKIPCIRDTDHDGQYSAEEIGLMSTATAVLLHTGWDAPKDAEHRSSIACQTCPLQYLKLLARYAKRAGGKIDYCLITAEDALDILAESPFWTSDTDPDELAPDDRS